MELLDRNVRVGRLEVDLVLRDGPAVVVVEVRSRGPGSWQRALESIDRAKRARLRRAGRRLWASRYQHVAGVERLRFDVVAVDLDTRADQPAVEHVKAAF